MMPNPLILILADDDKDDCLFFTDALGELPVTANLTTVHNGEQLMQLLADETVAPPPPHVLFLDLNMPRKNGFECLAEIKSDERLRQLPVIIFSTSFEQDVVNLLYKKGAHYYIRKPAEFALLKKVIYQALLLATENTSLQPAQEHFVLKGDSEAVQI
ncbi:MAG: response regulator [Bacteroidota bacterium]|nr:response regulator [Bacteroidota bacterium]MDP4234168.1 response regulator [Bacteroidota bacterium]MDP4244010.1 response regulator [Bacteroidota bacterium]MDP4287868.1 response regulator [Bacteroidota bacterium]